MEVIIEVVEHGIPKMYKLKKDKVIIGRDNDKSDIVLYEEGASKQHCLIEYSCGRYWVTDLSSKNGTYINHVRIDRHVFYLDDIVQIGNSYIRFAEEKMSTAVVNMLREPGKKLSKNGNIVYSND